MRDKIFPILVAIILSLVFFNQVLLGKIPFPGDSLVANFEPYKSFSYFGFAPGAVPNKAQGPDVIRELLPWKKFTIDSWKMGQVPFWDPYNFSGNPLMANFQSGVFYPGNLLFLVTNFAFGWSLFITLTPILSIYFTYLFLRRLTLDFWPSVFGGLSFAFSSYMTVWMEYGNIGHTFLWLPLILYFADRLIEKTSRTNLLGLVLTCFVAALAGYIQGLFYIYAIVFLYFFIKAHHDKKLNIHRIIIFLAGLIFPILLSSFQLLPTLELFSESSRGSYTLLQIQKMLNPIQYLITLVSPDFFGNPATRNYWFDGTYIERVSYFGLIPFVLAIFAIVALIKKVEVKVFAVLFVFSILIATDIFISRFFYLIPIPVLSTTVATRILSISTFCGALLAAFGLQELLEGKSKRQIVIVSSAIFTILVFVFGSVVLFGKTTSDTFLLAGLAIAKRNLIIPLASFAVFIAATFYLIFFKQQAKIKKLIFLAVVFAVTTFDLLYYFQKITPFAPKEFLYPETPVVTFLQKNAGINRFWGYGLGYIDSNFQTYDKTLSTEGNDPLHIRSYTELLASSKNGRVPQVLPRPDANIAGGFGKEDLAGNLFRQKVLNVSGVKYVLNKDEGLRGGMQPDEITFPPDRYKLVWQDGFWQAYENLGVTPRFFLTNNYVVAQNENRARHILFGENFDETKQLILYENPNIPSGKLNADATLVNYSANKVEISTNTKESSLLYLSDNYYKGWKAYVDGKITKIYLTNYTFRSVVVPSGKHLVSFVYKPKSFYLGLYVSAVSLVAFGLFYLTYAKKNKA